MGIGGGLPAAILSADGACVRIQLPGAPPPSASTPNHPWLGELILVWGWLQFFFTWNFSPWHFFQKDELRESERPGAAAGGGGRT